MSTDSTGTAARDGQPTTGPGDSAFVRACRRQAGPHTPVWFMRQAGRSLPEYREIRANVGMLESCRRPELVTEITLQPVRRHGVDAAILFSDIVVPVAAAGIELDIVPGTGPVVAQPIRDADDVERIRPIGRDDVPYVDEAVTTLVAELGDTPLIGFAGAPFTLASYLVEGGPSRTHARTKALMHGDPQLWHALCARLAEVTLAFLRVQVAAGVSAVQLFDSWAGALSEADYRRNVLRPRTVLKLSLRLPPTIEGAKAGQALKALLEAEPPYGAKVTFEYDQTATGWHAPATAPWLEKVLNETSQKNYGKPAMWMGEGGTIPFMAMLGAKYPQAQFLITGVLGPHSNAHGPNEFLHIGYAKKLTACVVDVLAAQAAS